MGAPGYYILCPKGHQIGLIEDDLYWDDRLEKELEDLKNKNCPICGQKAKFAFGHYGNINDCVDTNLNGKLRWNPKENRWIIPRKIVEGHGKMSRYITIKNG